MLGVSMQSPTFPDVSASLYYICIFGACVGRTAVVRWGAATVFSILKVPSSPLYRCFVAALSLPCQDGSCIALPLKQVRPKGRKTRCSAMHDPSWRAGFSSLKRSCRRFFIPSMEPRGGREVCCGACSTTLSAMRKTPGIFL